VMQTGGLLKDLTIGETVRLVELCLRTPTGGEVLERAGISDIATPGRQGVRWAAAAFRFALALLQTRSHDP